MNCLLLQGMSTGSMSHANESGNAKDAPDIRKLLRATLDNNGSDLHLTVGRPPSSGLSEN